VLAEFESPPGTYFDASPIHIITDRSLGTLAALSPASSFDVRRFRPNIVIAVGPDVDGELPEQAWLGRTLRIGDVELEVTLSCPRCVMVTRDFADLPHDQDVLRTIIANADQNVGVYANVRNPGMLDVGATVSLRDAS
jgi:hypothetical protein